MGCVAVRERKGLQREIKALGCIVAVPCCWHIADLSGLRIYFIRAGDMLFVLGTFLSLPCEREVDSSEREKTEGLYPA